MIFETLVSSPTVAEDTKIEFLDIDIHFKGSCESDNLLAPKFLNGDTAFDATMF